MRRYLSLAAWLWCLSLGGAATAPNPTDSPDLAPLEQVPDEVSTLDEELLKAVDAARTAVETEAAAGRLSETAAHSLRWTLRSSSTAYAGADMRGLLATARVPFDNESVSKAFKAMEATWMSVQKRRADLQRSTIDAAQARAIEAMKAADTKADVQRTITAIEAAREALQRGSGYGSGELWNSTRQLETTLASLATLLEARDTKDLGTMAQAANGLISSSYSDRVLGQKMIRERVGELFTPYTQPIVRARESLDTGIQAHKSPPELDRLLEQYESAINQLGAGRGYITTPGFDDVKAVPSYRDILAAARVTADTPADTRRSVFQRATDSLANLAPDRAALFRPLIASWQEQLDDSVSAAARKQEESWKTRLAAVKDPAALAELAAEMQRSANARRSGRGDDASAYAQLAAQLTALAARWSSGSKPATRELYAERLPAALPLAAECEALQKRVEREVLIRLAEAPELNQSPYVEQPFDSAVKALCQDLAKRDEWRRVLRLLESREATQSPDVRPSFTSIISAIREYLAAANFELAEQWSEAVESYKKVLRSADELTPISASAERLKAIKKEHPDAFAARPAAPGPGPTPR